MSKALLLTLVVEVALLFMLRLITYKRARGWEDALKRSGPQTDELIRWLKIFQENIDWLKKVREENK